MFCTRCGLSPLTSRTLSATSLRSSFAHQTHAMPFPVSSTPSWRAIRHQRLRQLSRIHTHQNLLSYRGYRLLCPPQRPMGSTSPVLGANHIHLPPRPTRAPFRCMQMGPRPSTPLCHLRTHPTRAKTAIVMRSHRSAVFHSHHHRPPPGSVQLMYHRRRPLLRHSLSLQSACTGVGARVHSKRAAEAENWNTRRVRGGE